MNRVVITGMGALTSLGKTPEELQQALMSGTCGIHAISAPAASGYKAHLAAEISDFDPALYMDKRQARRMDRYCQFAVAAAKGAWEQAGLSAGGFDPYRAGVIVGSGIGGIATFEAEHTKLLEKGMARISPLFIPMMIPNMAAGMISMEYGLKGASYCTVSACASGSHAIGEAFRAIKHGYLDIAVTGGADAVVTPIAVRALRI